MSQITVCDFCGKTEKESTPDDILIEGPGDVCICNMCVERFMNTVLEHKRKIQNEINERQSAISPDPTRGKGTTEEV